MLNSKDVQEVLAAVESIQWDISEIEECDEFAILYKSNGICSTVEFEGIRLWHSEDDDRNFSEATNEYEPFEPFLRNQLKIELDKLSKIRKMLDYK